MHPKTKNAYFSFKMKYCAVIGTLFLGFSVLLASADNPTQPYKVYGNMWSYANNWNDPGNTMKTTFSDGPKPAMNVTFNRNNYLAYPAHVRGWHYNLNPVPNDTALPQQVSKLSKIPVKFAYFHRANDLTGVFAYRMLLRKDSSKTTPELEVLVWAYHNSLPVGNQSSANVITLGGLTYDLWEGQNSVGYYVYTFIPHGSADATGLKKFPAKGSLSLDVKVFLNWLQKNKARDGHYSDDMYLDCVEVGFLILGGNGWVYFTAYVDVV